MTYESESPPVVEIVPAHHILAVDTSSRTWMKRSSTWVKLHVLFADGPDSLNARLTGNQIKVFLAIALRIDEAGSSVPSVARIARDSGLSVRSVRRALHGWYKSAANKERAPGLVDIGLVSVLERNGETNEYVINGFAAYGQDNDPKLWFHASNVNQMSLPEGDATSGTPTPASSGTPPLPVVAPKEEPLENHEEEPIDAEASENLPELPGGFGMSEVAGALGGYTIQHNLKDPEVNNCGRVTKPPWKVTCPCGNEVMIHMLDTPYECLNGDHEFIILGKRANPNAHHPAIQAYRRTAGAWPDPALHKEIAETIGDTVDELQRWQLIVKTQISKGYNRKNIAYLLKCFKEGHLPGERSPTDRAPSGWEAGLAEIEKKVQSVGRYKKVEFDDPKIMPAIRKAGLTWADVCDSTFWPKTVKEIRDAYGSG